MQNLIKKSFFVFCFFPLMGMSQISFYKVFSNNGYDFGQGIVQLEDSSYVITGSSSSFTEGAAQAFLLKVDSLGNYIWSHDYGGEETDWGRRVLYKKNVGFYIAGYTNSIGNGGFDAYLAKTDENGTLEWEKAYGDDGWEKINDAVMLADTGIMMVGQTNSNTSGNDDIYIVRTDKDGDTLWTKTLGSFTGNDKATSIRILNDTVCAIGGQMYNEDSLLYKAYLMRVNINGTIEWEDYYGDNGEYGINDLCVVGDHINVVGYNEDTLTGDIDPYAAKIYDTGILSYEFAFHGESQDIYNLVTPYANPAKLYMAYSQKHDGFTYPNGYDLFVYQFTETLLYDYLGIGIANEGEDVGGQLISTSDGTAIIVGYNSAFGIGGNNIFLMKIGPNNAFPNPFGEQPINDLVGVYENVLDENPTFLVYPNPATLSVTIELPKDFEGKLTLTNITGMTVGTSHALSGNNSNGSINFNIDHLPKGNYFISMESIDGVKNTKMITVY